jgi:hypothetical protein
MPRNNHNNDNEQYKISGPSSRHNATNHKEHSQTRLDKLLSSVRSEDSLLDLFGKLSGNRKDMSIRHKEAGKELKNALDQMHEAVLSVMDSQLRDVENARQQTSAVTLLQRFEELQMQHLSGFQAAQYRVTSDQIESVRLLYMKQEEERSHATNDIEGMRRLQEREDLVKVLETDRTAMQRLGHQVEEGEAYARNAMIAACRLDEGLREVAMKEILDQQLGQIETLQNNLVASHIQLKEVDLNKLTAKQIELNIDTGQNRERERSAQDLERQFNKLPSNEVLNKTLGEFDPLKQLWDQAVRSLDIQLTKENARDLYNIARDKFVRLLVDTRNEDSRAARELFESAGYRFQASNRHDTLNKAMPVIDDPLLAKHLTYLDTSISLQHLDMLGDKQNSENWKNALNADRLMMMSLRDNIHMDAERYKQQRDDFVKAYERIHADKTATQDKEV